MSGTDPLAELLPCGFTFHAGSRCGAPAGHPVHAEGWVGHEPQHPYEPHDRRTGADRRAAGVRVSEDAVNPVLPPANPSLMGDIQKGATAHAALRSTPAAPASVRESLERLGLPQTTGRLPAEVVHPARFEDDSTPAAPRTVLVKDEGYWAGYNAAKAEDAGLYEAALAVYHGKIGYDNPTDPTILALGAVLFPDRAALRSTPAAPRSNEGRTPALDLTPAAPQPDPEPYPCSCGRSFRRAADLGQHRAHNPGPHADRRTAHPSPATTPSVTPQLREALHKFVTGEGAMATDPDGDCYFCEAEGVDFELPFHPGADPDHAGEHKDWCLVPIARAALDAPALTVEADTALTVGRAQAVVYTHAARVTDGTLVCAAGDFDGSTVFEAHVAAILRAPGEGDGE